MENPGIVLLPLFLSLTWNLPRPVEIQEGLIKSKILAAQSGQDKKASPKSCHL